ncbi:uncharacterized protein CHAB577_0150 [Chlamydia abortus]|nr:uncharacterized protein CHAB577_0150 [Chlamydia abortus]
MVPQAHPEANKKLNMKFFISILLVVYAKQNTLLPYLEN